MNSAVFFEFNVLSKKMPLEVSQIRLSVSGTFSSCWANRSIRVPFCRSNGGYEFYPFLETHGGPIP